MDKTEILQHIINSHNRLVKVMVSGDNAIMVADTLREMRMLAQDLQSDIDAEGEDDSLTE